MRKLMLAASAAALLSTMSLAYAADASGTITAVDPSSGSVTLDDGNTYMLPASVAAADLKVGEKVTITYDQNGDKMEATAVTPAS